MLTWRAIGRSAWGLLIVAILVGALLLFMPKWRSLGELHRVRGELERENARIAADTAALIRSQQRFQSDPAFVERTAHESGRVKSNETVFLFPNE